MRTYENKFDQLVQELLKQKQMFESLVVENQELHRQLAALRAGRGVFVEIGGERFVLGDEVDGIAASTSPPSSESTHMNQAEPATAALPAFGRSEELEMRVPSATTRPMTALPASKPPSPTSREEEATSLRRELMGSLMLD